jgi:hypothetical protein
VGTGSTWHLVPLRIGQVMFQPNYGFTYFQLDIESATEAHVLLYTRDEEGTPTQHHSVVNYGHLLPHLPSLNGAPTDLPVPYSIVTTDANHMNASYVFI